MRALHRFRPVAIGGSPWDHGRVLRMRRREASAEERLERLLELQTLLARVAREIGPALELQPVLNSVLRAMRSLVDFRGGSIQLVDAGLISIAAADPPVSEDVARARFPARAGLGVRS